MPLHEYQCDACGHRFEAIQKFSDAPLHECPKCGGALRKLQAAPAIKFKGSGWYITDYAKKSSAPAGKGDSDSSDSGGSKESASTDKAEKADKADRADTAKTEKSSTSTDSKAAASPATTTSSKDS